MTATITTSDLDSYANMLKIPKKDLSNDMWLAIRRYTGIGSSEAAAAVGCSRYQTQYALWEIKTGLREPPDLSTVERVQRGTDLEPVVAQMFKAAHPEWRVVHDNFIRRHPEYRSMLCNIDRLVQFGDRRPPMILEIKNVERENDWKDGVPPEYYIQVQHQMAVYGAQVGIPFGTPMEARVAVLFHGNAFREFVVPRDEDVIRNLGPALDAFWRCVQRREPPTMSTVGDSRLRWPDSRPMAVTATQDALEAIRQITALQAQCDGLNAEVERLKAKVAAYMAEAEVLVDDDGTRLATFKSVTSNRIDTTALKAALPDVAARFTKTSTTRVFRLL